VAAAVAGLVSAADPSPTRVAVLLAVVVAATLPLAFDGLVGVLVGLLAAAGLAGAKQLLGTWTFASFGRSLLTSLLLILLGWSTGRLGKRLRARANTAPAHRDQDAMAFGSLGLIPEAAALARLDEEVDRATRHRRPLSVILVRTTLTDATLDEDTASRARRVAARQFEGALRRTDVPFALAADMLGAVLVETNSDGAWEVAANVLERAGAVGFADRGRRHRLTLQEYAELSAGIASLPEDGTEAQDLLSVALAALDAQVLTRTPSATGVEAPDVDPESRP
jgi:GGDEF domain-containing protein